LDFLKGGKIRKHYSEIVLVLKYASSNEALQRQEKDLSAILHHAVTTTLFYEQKNNYKSLNDFPVINKSIVRESFNSFISSKFKESELIPVVTSGSTGTPFKVYHDKNKKLRNSADTIFFAQMAGYDLGERLIYMKIFVKEKMKNPVSYWMENTIPVDVIRLNEPQIESLLFQMENDKSSYTILGYASALEIVCKYLNKNNYGRVKANVKSVIAMSETLNDFTKETMQKYFSAPVVSRYSNLENGIIAQQETTGSGRYFINMASYVVEILKMDSDEQVKPGQTGRIIVTDLFNYGMPLIRYDTGDIGAISSDSRKAGNMYFVKIEGRKLDLLYDTNGNLVSSYMVYKNMWQYTEIIQYQLVQEGRREYNIKINADDNFNKEAKLIKEFRTYLGEDAVFTVEYVAEIPFFLRGRGK
jgi:phenylacetate-CoA ligase